MFCETARQSQKLEQKTQMEVKLGQFNVVMTNPPFGSKIPVRGESILKQYEFAHSWKYDKKAKSGQKEN